MYTHSNKQPPIDICQSLIRLALNRRDDFDSDMQLNVKLIVAEAYQTTGQTDQASCQYEQAKILDQSIVSSSAVADRARKKKIEEIGMKIIFQCQFQRKLLESIDKHESG